MVSGIGQVQNNRGSIYPQKQPAFKASLTTGEIKQVNAYIEYDAGKFEEVTDLFEKLENPAEVGKIMLPLIDEMEDKSDDQVKRLFPLVDFLTTKSEKLLEKSLTN